MKKMTIREVARLANVSPSAVSIVLNDRKGVSDETRERVKGIIDQLGYAPNPSSRRLLFNKTNNIAILFQKKTSPLEHFFYSEINTAVLCECEDKGYNLIFASFVVENNEVIFPNLIKSYDVDGVIFYGDVDAAVLNSLAKYEIPYIVIDNHAMLPGVLSVSADYKHAAYVSVSHLLRLGHKKIAYIGNGQLTNFNTQTFAGYKQALQEKNISISAEWIQFDASQEESAYRCMKNILLSAKSPPAVFCCADIYAIGAIKIKGIELGTAGVLLVALVFGHFGVKIVCSGISSTGNGQHIRPFQRQKLHLHIRLKGNDLGGRITAHYHAESFSFQLRFQKHDLIAEQIKTGNTSLEVNKLTRYRDHISELIGKFHIVVAGTPGKLCGTHFVNDRIYRGIDCQTISVLVTVKVRMRKHYGVIPGTVCHIRIIRRIKIIISGDLVQIGKSGVRINHLIQNGMDYAAVVYVKQALDGIPRSLIGSRIRKRTASFHIEQITGQAFVDGTIIQFLIIVLRLLRRDIEHLSFTGFQFGQTDISVSQSLERNSPVSGIAFASRSVNVGLHKT